MAVKMQQRLLRGNALAFLLLFCGVHESFSFVVPRKSINGLISPFFTSSIHQRFSFANSQKEYSNNNGVNEDGGSVFGGKMNSTESSSSSSASTFTASDISASEALELLKQQVIAQTFVNNGDNLDNEQKMKTIQTANGQNQSPSSSSASSSPFDLPDFQQDDLMKAVEQYEKYHLDQNDQYHFFGTTEQELATMTLVAAKYIAKVQELQQRERDVSLKISQLTSVARAIREETTLASKDQEKSQYELSQAMLKVNDLEYQLNVSQTWNTKLQDKLDMTQGQLSAYQHREVNITQKILKLEAVAQTLREDRVLREASSVAQQKSKDDLAKALQRIHELENQLTTTNITSTDQEEQATLKQTLKENIEVIETFQQRERDLGTKVSELESVAKTIRNDTMMGSSSSTYNNGPSASVDSTSSSPKNKESVLQRQLQEALTKIMNLEQELNMTLSVKHELQETLDETNGALENATAKLSLLEEKKGAAMDVEKEAESKSPTNVKQQSISDGGVKSSHANQLSMALEKLSALKQDATKFSDLEFQVWELQQQNQDLIKNNTRLATNIELAAKQEELLLNQLQEMQNVLDKAFQEKTSAQASAADSALQFVMREEALESRAQAAEKDQSSALSALEVFQSKLTEALDRVQLLEDELAQASKEAEKKKQEAKEKKRAQQKKEEEERQTQMKQLQDKAAQAIQKGREAFFFTTGNGNSLTSTGSDVNAQFLLDDDDKLKIFSKQMEIEKEKWNAQRVEQEQQLEEQKQLLDQQHQEQKEERLRQEALLDKLEVEKQQWLVEQESMKQSLAEEKLNLEKQRFDQKKQQKEQEQMLRQIEQERQQWELEEEERRKAIQKNEKEFQSQQKQEERQRTQQEAELKRQDELKAQEQKRLEALEKEKAQLQEQRRLQEEREKEKRKLAMEREKARLEEEEKILQEALESEKAKLVEEQNRRKRAMEREKAQLEEEERKRKLAIEREKAQMEEQQKQRKLAMEKEKAKLEEELRAKEELEEKKRKLAREKEVNALQQRIFKEAEKRRKQEEKMAEEAAEKQKRMEQQQPQPQASLETNPSASLIDEFFGTNGDDNIGDNDSPSLIDQLKEATEIMSFLKPTPVAELHDWSINEAGEVSGTVLKHSSIDDGETIRTSPLKYPRLAKAQKVVVTETGSKYRLCKPLAPEEEQQQQPPPPSKMETAAPKASVAPKQQEKPKSVSSSLPPKKTNPSLKNKKKIVTIDPKAKKTPPKPAQKVDIADGLRLTGDSIGDGKYLLAGKPIRGNKSEHRSEIWTAYRADEDGQPVGEALAIKVSSRHEAIKREYVNYQRVAVSGLSRGVFVKRLEFFSTAGTSKSFSNKCALVMEMGKDDLKGHIHQHGKLEGKQLKDVATAVVQCLQAVHAAGMVWTDLKAENFIVFETDRGDYQYKGIDLESAIQVNGNPVDYTPEASPPEFAEAFLNGESLEFVLQKNYDTWSLGMLLYEISTGRGYFDGKSTNQITQMLKDRTFAFDLDSIEDRRLKDLIAQCLHEDPKKRPSVTQVMMHPYFVLSGVGPFRFK